MVETVKNSNVFVARKLSNMNEEVIALYLENIEPVIWTVVVIAESGKSENLKVVVEVAIAEAIETGKVELDLELVTDMEDVVIVGEIVFVIVVLGLVDNEVVELRVKVVVKLVVGVFPVVVDKVIVDVVLELIVNVTV